MRQLPRLVPLALLASCASSLERPASLEQASPLERPPPPEHYLSCDALPGEFSEWSRTVSSKALRISGTVELIEPRHDPNWLTAANVSIDTKGGTSLAGLRTYLDWNSPELLHFALIGPGAPQAGQDVLSFPWHQGQGQFTPFIVTLSGSGTLSVYAGGSTLTLQVPGLDFGRVHLSCSSGRFKFRNVIVEEQ